MTKKLLIATKNMGKLNEYKTLFGDDNIAFLSLNDVNFPDVDETGTTFKENALLKARSGFEHTGIPTIAEDSGLCVDALDGTPGIYTARYGGMEKLLSALEGAENRQAHYHCHLTYIDENGAEHHFTADMPGTIAAAIKGDNGFGFDPIFIPKGMAQTVGELDESIIMPIRHRTKCFQQFKLFLTS